MVDHPDVKDVLSVKKNIEDSKITNNDVKS
jgi:hypothetical protein